MDPPVASGSHNKPSGEEKYSTSEILSDAKYVAEAAKSALRNESEKVDKAKAADSAGDLLDAGGQYAKLDDQKGVGQYVDKAADYLHQYPSTTAASKPDQSKGDDAAAQSTGGFGGVAKMAGGLFK